MKERRYMLDTNTARYIIRGEPVEIREHLLKVPMANMCISTITEADGCNGYVDSSTFCCH